MDKREIFRASPTFPAGRSDPLHIAALRAGRNMLAISCIAALALLAGCAENKQHVYEENLARMAHWLPGTYDNTLQAKQDVQKGVRPAHDAVELAVVPLDSVSIGRNSFYLQEAAADDPRRVFSQQVVMFKVTPKGIIESIADLVEPLRWRDGQRESGIFMGMTPKDLKPINGCELLWEKEGESDKAAKKPSKDEAPKTFEKLRFIGTNDPKKCEQTSRVVMGLVNVELRGELTMNELSLAELQYDSNGQVISGNKDEPFYRFRKIGSR